MYIPDNINPTHAGQLANMGASGTDAEKQAWLAKYAIGPSAEPSAPGVLSVEQVSAILRDQFGILPKRKAIGYSKPYPSDYDLIPLPPKYRLPEFTKFSGSEGASSIEHVSDLSVGSSKGPFLLPVSHGFSFWMVYITAPRFDPDLEAAGRSIPHLVSFRGC